MRALPARRIVSAGGLCMNFATAGTHAQFLQGGGELGALIRGYDWAASPLGTPDGWPQSLKTALRIMLTSRQPIWVGWGSELTYFYNDAYKAIIGGKHPQALGRPTVEVWAEIRDDIGPMLDQAMSGGEGTYVEAQLLIMERSGYPEETYYTFSYSPIPGDDGSAGGIICANTDDTRRVIGERQLALLSELGARTADSRTREDACRSIEAALSTDPQDITFALLFLADGEGDFALAASCRVDAGRQESRQWPLREVIRSQETRLVADLAARLGGEPPCSAWPLPSAQAALLPVASAGEQGRPGVLVVGLNPYRLFDDGYRGFLDLAAGQIAAAIANAEAYEQERRRAEALAELDRAKTAFFSNISHEFRTPLTLMLGPLEEILARPEADGCSDDRALVEVAHRNALRLTKLVNALLDFSRIEAGRVEARYQATDLAAFTAELASTFRSATDRAGLRLQVEAAPYAGTAYVDRDMWEKIVLNLLSNAFKFTLDGEIRIALREAGDRLRLEVADTGIGIAEDDLPRLFERFQRVEGAKGRTFEGSGIGLALVQELARMHGGEVSVASRLGEGTCFTVAIPLEADHLDPARIIPPDGEAAPRRAASFVEEALRWLPEDGEAGFADADADPGADERAALPDGPPARIVLADDNADMRDYVRRLLTPRYRVEAVADGEAALAAIRRERPDLLLTDVMMPRLGGFELLRIIRADEALKGLAVVMLSARAGEEARVEGIEAGADDYLVKPFSAREMIARVSTNLELSRARRRAEEALRDLNQSLEERVAAVIAEREVMEEALRQAQKMEAVGQLTGGIAHDFNNLLTIITGNLDMAQRSLRDADTGRLRRALGNALKGAERAASLTQRLLAFSRRQPLAPQPLDLDRLIQGMSELLKRTLGETVLLETVTTPGLWRIEADPNQLESALLNLAVNARDAMPAGGRLTIETANARLDEDYAANQAEVAPGNYVVIAVSDTGLGMGRETLARVFEPFFTTKEIGKGTGLGLSMVYGFVKQSGGHVKIYSEEGVGTTVKIYLPRLAGDVALPEPPERGATAQSSLGETILVVEDDDDVRAYTAEILRELGYQVIEAHDGPTALRILERADRKVDLLFTDVIMPLVSGRELADAAQLLRPQLKVLYTSGYTWNAIVHGGRLDSGVEMIAKPFSYQSLSTKIRDVLDARSWGRLLLVEHDPRLRMLTAEALTGFGYAVDEAANATEALGRLRAIGGAYAAVLLGIGADDGRGTALAREIRAQHRDLPMLLSSSGDVPENALAPDRCTRWIRKPHKAEAIREALVDLGIPGPPARAT